MPVDAVPLPTTASELVAFYPQSDLVWIAVQLVSIGIPLLFLVTGLSARLRAKCARMTRSRGGELCLFTLAYLMLAALIALPTSYLAEISFMRAWNAPTPSWLQWLAQRATSVGMQLFIGVTLVSLPYALLRRGSKCWWALSTAAIVPLLGAGLVVYQIGVMPIIENVQPLQDSPLASRIEALAARCGVPIARVWQGGGDTTLIGVGPLRRIVLSEDMLRDLSETQQVTMVAHEIKHYLLDSWKGLAVVGVLMLVGLWLVDVLGRRVIARFRDRLGFVSLADPASLPLMILILTIAWTLVGLPVFNATQQHAELAADRFALELTRENRAHALVQVHYARYKLNEYYPFHALWRDTHPSQSVRVRLANEYRPWETGEPLEFAGLCDLR